MFEAGDIVAVKRSGTAGRKTECRVVSVNAERKEFTGAPLDPKEAVGNLWFREADAELIMKRADAEAAAAAKLSDGAGDH